MTEIVRLSQDTAGLLSRIAEGVFDEPVNPRYLEMFLSDPRHVMFLAVDQNIVIGMASGVEYFHPDKAPQLWINEVGVAPDFQRRGTGRALTQALISEADSRGCVYAWLGTSTDNVSGQACFNSVPEGEPPQAFLLYEWDLED